MSSTPSSSSSSSNSDNNLDGFIKNLSSSPYNPFRTSSTHLRDDVVADTNTQSEAPVDPRLLILTSFTFGSIATLAATRISRKYLRRYRTSEWITPDVLAKKRWIRGVVVNVGDADNFRLYHTPGIGWRWPLKFRRIPSSTKDLRDQTIHIRMAGIDAPEASHFGRPAQQYAVEALAWLRGQVEGKTVYCQLLRRDQYGRIVAIPTLPPLLLPSFLKPFFPSRGKCLSLEMIKAGWCVTYEQANAEYGTWGKELFVSLEEEAKQKKRGMWKYGVNGETPAEYKRRYASDPKSLPELEAQKTPPEEAKTKRWWSWRW